MLRTGWLGLTPGPPSGDRRERTSTTAPRRDAADEGSEARWPARPPVFGRPGRRRCALSSRQARSGSPIHLGTRRRRRARRHGRPFPRRRTPRGGRRSRTRLHRRGRRPTGPRAEGRPGGPCTRRLHPQPRRRPWRRAPSAQREPPRPRIDLHSGLLVQATERPEAMSSRTAPAPANAAVTSRASRFLPRRPPRSR